MHPQENRNRKIFIYSGLVILLVVITVLILATVSARPLRGEEPKKEEVKVTTISSDKKIEILKAQRSYYAAVAQAQAVEKQQDDNKQNALNAYRFSYSTVCEKIEQFNEAEISCCPVNSHYNPQIGSCEANPKPPEVKPKEKTPEKK